MPAASADKRARQRVNKLSHKETAPSALVPPAESVETTPPPMTTNIASMVCITKNDLDRMHEKAYRDGFAKGVADATEKLKAKYENDSKQAIAEILEQAQERYDEDRVSAFELGHSSGIEDEREYQESVRERQISIGVQVDLPLDDDLFFTPTTVEIPLPFTSEIGLQTSPSIPFALLPPPFPSPVFSTPIPIIPIVSIEPSTAPVAPQKLSWDDDSASLPVIPLFKTPRDFSALRSNNRPFGTLRNRKRRCYRTARHIPIPPTRFSSPNTHHHYQQSYPPSQRPKTAPFLPPALDWDQDPRLFELSRVLRSLGWSHSPSSRP